MAISAAEQYLLELINRARLDPLAEAARYDLDLNADLASGTIDGSAKGVLAPNTTLEAAALTHSAWMLDEDTFSHTGDGGSSPGDRITAAGYSLTGQWSWRENLAWSGTTGTLDLEGAIEIHHEGLYRSAGHRVNTFADDTREIGIAQLTGTFTQNGTGYNASMLTLKFARSGTDHFVTGVAYTDLDGDDFYSIGEGTAGLRISAGGTTTTTADAGGYRVAVTPDEAVEVTVEAADTTPLATLEIDLSDGNAKLDVITDGDGNQTLALSASATMNSGIADALLLGVADLDLTGSALANILTGNSGRNVINGADGDDTIDGAGGADWLLGGEGNDILRGGEGREVRWDSLTGGSAPPTDNADLLQGGAGDDRLHGQSGRDRLDGGEGDDRMTGGGGRDTFVFNAGTDRILDFDDNVDMIELDGAALGLGGSTVADVIDTGQIIDGDAVFDFAGGHRLRVVDVDDLSLLLNDMIIV